MATAVALEVIKAGSPAISSHQHWQISPDASGKKKCNTSNLPIIPRAFPSSLEPEKSTRLNSRKQGKPTATL
jgi:hypothetical protein